MASWTIIRTRTSTTGKQVDRDRAGPARDEIRQVAQHRLGRASAARSGARLDLGLGEDSRRRRRDSAVDCAATELRTVSITLSCRPARSALSPSATGAMKPSERSCAARLTEGATPVCCSEAMTPVSCTTSAANASARCSIEPGAETSSRILARCCWPCSKACCTVSRDAGDGRRQLLHLRRHLASAAARRSPSRSCRSARPSSRSSSARRAKRSAARWTSGSSDWAASALPCAWSRSSV